MKVAIRADAWPTMGSGHIMRCLCLADALRVRGARVTSLCRSLPPHLANAITAGGHSLRTLPLLTTDDAPQNNWPEDRQTKDAHATCEALEGFVPDWLVVDHYGLGREWENVLRPVVRRLMVIDDLARPHNCDLLLDINLQAQPQTRYEGRVPTTTQLLLGPHFALLRPEFRAARKKMHPRTGAVQRLLVFMGGMDAGNATGTVLQAIALTAQRGLALDIVIGTSHPAREAVTVFCAAWPLAKCHVQTDQMAALLARCDLAIGAGGGATWERCCLGVPTLALALADNQRTQLGALAAAGLAYVPNDPLPEAARLSSHLLALLDNNSLREAMSKAGMALVDGQGAQRVSSAMLAGLVRLRPAAPSDSARVFEWRNAPRVREMSLDNTEIAKPLHKRWFEQVLAASDQVLLIGEDDEGPAGVVRFDLSEDSATISIYLAQERFGQGLGSSLLRAAEHWLATSHPEILWVHAQVRAVNTASLRLFEQGGYRLDFYHFSRKIQA